MADEQPLIERRSTAAEHETRLSRVEALLESSVKSLEGQIEKIATTLNTVAQNQNNSSRTNWGTVLSGVALILSLVVALGTGFVGKPLSDLTYRFEQNLVESRDLRIQIRDKVTKMDRENAADHAAEQERLRVIERDMERDYANMIILNNKINNTMTTDTQLESRITNLERLMFPDTKYRAGKPD